MSDNFLRKLPDGKIISLMIGPNRDVDKEVKEAAAAEWRRRMHERNMKVVEDRWRKKE